MRSRGGRLVGWLVVAGLVVGFVGFVGGRVLGPLDVDAGALATGPFTLGDLVFYALAAMAVLGAAGVALSRNILYSAIGLLVALLGVGGLYVHLSADFVAVTQLLVYIGGVLVLVLFAVMLTAQIGDVHVSNRSFGLAGGVMLFLAVAPVLLAVAVRVPWAVRPAPALSETTAAIGNAFLKQWLLPFELASLILLSTLVGAIVIARKEIKAE